MLASKKGASQIRIENLPPRRDWKFVDEPSEINSSAREETIRDSKLVTDDLKGFRNLFFLGDVA